MVVCECGDELDAKVELARIGADVLLEVPACEKCLEKAREEGAEDAGS
ncbi:MAG: hypothetical protein ACYTAF_07970 [Planctomycetota bacterium]